MGKIKIECTCGQTIHIDKLKEPTSYICSNCGKKLRVKPVSNGEYTVS